MAEIRRSEVRELGAASQDPYAMLAVEIVIQAVRDLVSSDPVQRWDALMWFLDPGVTDLMQYAGINVDPLCWLTVS